MRRLNKFGFVLVQGGRGRAYRLTRYGRFLSGAAAAALAACSGLAFAQSTPAPVTTPTPTPAEPAPRPGQDDIVVTAPAEQRSIDRDTYIVRDTAEARALSTFDILSRLPLVETQPNGTIRILGTGTATILVDGHRVPDAANYLRNMQGAQVARIEVLTNPGAQFPASGQGGIINIVTRRSFLEGIGGSLTGKASSPESYDLRASPTWSHGNWSLSANPGLSGGRSSNHGDTERFRVEPGGPVFDSSRTVDGRSSSRAITVALGATYRPNDHETFSLSSNLSHGATRAPATALLTSPSLSGGDVEERELGRVTSDLQDVTLDYRGESSRPGQNLTASAKWSRLVFNIANRSVIDPDGPGETELIFGSRYGQNEIELHTEYVQPLGGHRQLSFGALASRIWSIQDQAGSGVLPLGGDSLSSIYHLRTTSFTHASDATFQFLLAGVTAKAGLRIEGQTYNVPTSAAAVHRGQQTAVFPSLHLERVAAPWLTINASYSRRVDWPDPTQLDGEIVISSSTTGQAGNPLLRPQFIDALEGRFVTRFGHHNVDLVIFHRVTRGVFSFRSDFAPDGILITRPFNFGTQTRDGASLSARGPLLSHLRYSVSANLSAQRLDQDAIGSLSRDATFWSGSAQLEYRDGMDGRRGADRISVSARYIGPSDTGYSRMTGFSYLSATWSHALTDRLSSVFSLDSLALTRIRSETRSDTSLTFSQSRNVDRLSFALTWSFRPPPAPGH